MLNTYRVVPFDSQYGSSGKTKWYARSIPVSTSGDVVDRDAVSSPPQDDVYSLLRERIDLHAQLFDAVQIQRKLSGPRVLRHGDMQFASEVFAARFLSGDFTTFSQDGSKVLAVLGDIAGKGVAAGMWFTHLAGLLQSYRRPDFDPARIAWEMNRHLCYLQPVAPFVTAFFAQIDCEFRVHHLLQCRPLPAHTASPGWTYGVCSRKAARCWVRSKAPSSNRAS